MPDRTALASNADLLEIALAAARFPRTVPAVDPSLTLADFDRIAGRFGGFLAARLDGFAALAAPGAAAGAGFGAALRGWAARRFEGPGEAPAALAHRLGVPAEAGMVAAAALPALGGLARRDLPDLAALDSPGPGPVPLSRLFRLLVLALRLRRPDMFGAAGMDGSPRAVLDWAVVFGLAEHRLWHLLPPGDRRLLLGGTPQAPPLFLRSVLRFREDLRGHADRPLVLRDWLRGNASGEYGIALDAPARPAPRPGLLSVIGPWRQVLGIADDCFSACRALDLLGCDYEVVGTRVARWIETDRDKLAHLRDRAAEAPGGERALFCDTLFQATFWALENWSRFAAFRRVDLFAPWELPALPAGWRAAARLFDTVLAPSDFSRRAFAEAGAARALRVTSSVEVTGRHRVADAMALRRRLPAVPGPGRRRVLVCVFDFSSYLDRKNPEAALRAFAAVRRRVGNATLVVKTTRARRARAAAGRLRALLRGVPDVVWADGAWPNADVEALLRRADALVSLHRSEGFGRNIAKALLLGTRVVVTDWSGNADMAPEPGYLGVPPARFRRLSDRDYVLGAGQVWAEPDPRAAVRQMRAALTRGVPRAGRAALRFSRARLARRLARALEIAPTRG